MKNIDSIPAAAEHMRVVPLARDDTEGYLVVFDYRESRRLETPIVEELSEAAGQLDIPESGSVLLHGKWLKAVTTDAALATPTTTYLAYGAELIDAAPMIPAKRGLILGKTLEIRGGGRRRRVSTRYWLKDPLSGEGLPDLLASPWAGKMNDAVYMPIALGGRINVTSRTAPRNAVILATRVRRGFAPDTEEGALVAINLDVTTSGEERPFPFVLRNELTLFSVFAYEADQLMEGIVAAITPAARSAADGWVVAFFLGGVLSVVKIAANANSFMGPGPLPIPSGSQIAPRHLRIAGGDVEEGILPSQWGYYCVAWTSRPASERVSIGCTFQWPAALSSPLAPQSANYGPARAVLDLTADFATSSHWFLLLETETREDSTFFNFRLRRSRWEVLLLGFSAKAYRRSQFGRASLLPFASEGLRIMAVAFDPFRKRAAVVGSRLDTGSEPGKLEGTLVYHSSWVMAVPGINAECPRVVAGTEVIGRESHMPYAGHRFFTIVLEGGPKNQLVTLRVSSRVMPTADTCANWIDTGALGGEIYTVDKTTDASGKATETFEVSEANFPLLFSPSPEGPPGVIGDQPGLMVAQWSWFEIRGLDALRDAAVDFGRFRWPVGTDGPGATDDRVVLSQGRSNVLLLFVGP